MKKQRNLGFHDNPSVCRNNKMIRQWKGKGGIQEYLTTQLILVQSKPSEFGELAHTRRNLACSITWHDNKALKQTQLHVHTNVIITIVIRFTNGLDPANRILPPTTTYALSKSSSSKISVYNFTIAIRSFDNLKKWLWQSNNELTLTS
jgi:hypothetical protein